MPHYDYNQQYFQDMKISLEIQLLITSISYYTEYKHPAN